MTTPPPPYQPGGYQPGPSSPSPYPRYERQQRRPLNGFGVAALILGIVAVVIALLPFFDIFAMIVGGLAIIFGIIGVTRKDRAKGTSITGLICGGVSLLLAPLISYLAVVGFTAWEDRRNAGNHEVVYKVYTEKTGQVSYMDQGVMKEERIKGDWETTLSLPEVSYLSLMIEGDVYNYSNSEIRCEIILDGQTVTKKNGRQSMTCEYYVYE